MYQQKAYVKNLLVNDKFKSALPGHKTRVKMKYFINLNITHTVICDPYISFKKQMHVISQKGA
jgi:hypothetical protein